MAPTAVVAMVPAIETILRDATALLPPPAVPAMAPHVTLDFPFVDDAELGASQLRRLEAALASAGPFDATFARFGRFDGAPPTLYLEPAPVERFLAMIEAIVAEFPEHPPYGGAFDGIVPHLTVTQTDDTAAVARIEALVSPHLPVTAPVREIHVLRYAGAEGWHTVSQLPLRGDPGL